MLYEGHKFCFTSDGNTVFLFIKKTNKPIFSDREYTFRDSTFYYVPKFFIQYYTIHTYINYLYLLIEYCLLIDKNAETKATIWKILQNLSYNLIKQSIIINKFHTDFKRAAHNNGTL